MEPLHQPQAGIRKGAEFDLRDFTGKEKTDGGSMSEQGSETEREKQMAGNIAC